MEEDIKLRLPAGTYDLKLFLKSDSYRGLDQEREVKFKVLPFGTVHRVKTKLKIEKPKKLNKLMIESTSL